jgi:hypothetical protein
MKSPLILYYLLLYAELNSMSQNSLVSESDRIDPSILAKKFSNSYNISKLPWDSAQVKCALCRQGYPRQIEHSRQASKVWCSARGTVCFMWSGY